MDFIKELDKLAAKTKEWKAPSPRGPRMTNPQGVETTWKNPPSSGNMYSTMNLEEYNPDSDTKMGGPDQDQDFINASIMQWLSRLL